MSKPEQCNECNISPLYIRREIHLQLFMHKQSGKQELLQKRYNQYYITARTSFLII